MLYPEGLERRPRGLEQEIDIQLVNASGKPVNPSPEFVRKVLYPGHPHDTATGIFHRETGGRVYVDYNQLFEIASPEAVTAAEAAMSASQQRDDLITRLEKAIGEDAISAFFATNRVIGDGVSSLGAHESFLTLRRCFGASYEQVDKTNLARVVSSFLVARTVINGAGNWMPSRRRPYRVFPTQKMQMIRANYSLGTTSNTSKPLFNTRDEPHADPKLYARLHITSGDAHTLLWPSWMSSASTSLALRLVETGLGTVRRLTFAKPLEAAQKAATDPNARLQTSAGYKWRPIDMLEEYLTQYRIMALKVPVTEEDRQCMEELQEVIDDYRTDPDVLIGRVEWITRQYVIRSMYDKLTGLDRHQILKQLRKIDLLWDNLKPDLGLGLNYRDYVPFPGYDQERFEALRTTPPEGTRAAQRVRIFEQLATPGRRFIAQTDWATIKSRRETYSLLDPFGKIVKRIVVS